MATLFQFPYRTVAEISIRNLLRNLSTIRAISRREVIPVVKADAYGHGMVPIARALVERGSCSQLAVATLEEGIELRKKLGGGGLQILVLSGFIPHLLDAFLRYRLTPVIHSLYHLESLVHKPKLPELHLKIDSGMHRLGLMESEIPRAMELLLKMKVKLKGICSHYAESEKQLSAFTTQQLASFESIVVSFQEKKLLQTDAILHIGNSGAILREKLGITNAVRPGLTLMGISPNPQLAKSDDLVPVLQWKSRILCFKKIGRGDTVGYGRTYKAKRQERIALIPIGYADGYPRLLSNLGEVLVGGKRAKVKGRVSMDLTAIDVTGISDIAEGSLVTIIGGSGKDRVSATDIANWARTIPYEILCGISGRVQRLYLE